MDAGPQPPQRGRGRGRGQGSRQRDHAPKRAVQTDAQLGWTENDIEQLDLPLFTGHPGISQISGINHNSSPFEVFRYSFNDEIVDVIKTETNRYARVQIQKLKNSDTLKPNSIWNSWKAVQRKKLYVFFAIIIHMSLVQKPKIQDYWTSKAILKTTFTQDIHMARDRFLSILWMLHCNDNAHHVAKGQPGHDPLHKIRPVVDVLAAKFQSAYYPEDILDY